MRRLVAGLIAVPLLVVAGSAAAQPFVYTANASDSSVTVIDAATNTVATTIMVGSEPRNPAVSPDGSRVYVPNRFDDNVTVIDGTTNTVLTTINDPEFDEPYGAAVSPSGALVYVVNKEGGGSSTGSLTVINGLNNTVIDTVDDPCFVSPEWVVFNPAGSRAYVVSRQGDSVCVVETATHTVIDEVAVGVAPRSAVVTCDNAFVYVANNGGTVSKIRTSDNTVVNTLPFVGGAPRNLAITPDCAKIYVPLQNDTVGVIVTATDATSTITVPNADSTYGAAVIQNGTRVYVTDEDDDEVEVIDVATDTVLSGAGLPIPTGSTPRGIATASGVTSRAGAPAASLLGLALLAAGLLGFGARRRRRESTRA
jgi:YVTN family beta-propeller protein